LNHFLIERDDEVLAWACLGKGEEEPSKGG
jgi:hypothetical protein